MFRPSFPVDRPSYRLGWSAGALSMSGLFVVLAVLEELFR